MNRNKPHGILTNQLVKKLRELTVLGEMRSGFTIFADPHSSELHLDPPVMNRRIFPYGGERAARDSVLSWCDIMICENATRRVVLLLEVEETPNGASPKTILGDVFNIWMARGVRANKIDWMLDETRFWIVVFQGRPSKRKQYELVKGNLDKLAYIVQHALHADFRVTQTEIVPTPDSDSLVGTVLQKLRREVPVLFA